MLADLTPIAARTLPFSGRIPGALRPDYQEIFPVFRRAELLARLADLPWHLATLLHYHNIMQVVDEPACRDGLRRFFAGTWRDQQAQLGEVLRYLGLSAPVVDAVVGVARHRFVPLRLAPYSYLNTFIPFSRHSCLTPPGLVALMLEQLAPQPGEAILEVGAGSGYHTACLARLLDYDCAVVGIEVNRAFHEAGVRHLDERERRCVTLLWGDETHPAVQARRFDRIYATCTMPVLPPALVERLRPGGVIQVARALTAAEFGRIAPDNWLRRRYPTHAHYLAHNWQQANACLTLARRAGDDVALEEIDHVYSTIFVAYRTQAEAAQLAAQLAAERGEGEDSAEAHHPNPLRGLEPFV